MQHDGAKDSAMPSDDSSGTMVGELHSRGAVYFRTVDTPSGPRELAYIIPDWDYGTDDPATTADDKGNTAVL